MRRRAQQFLFLVLVCLIALALVRAAQLLMARTSPVSAYLVLGGTPNREIFAAKLVKEHPEVRGVDSLVGQKIHVYG